MSLFKRNASNSPGPKGRSAFLRVVRVFVHDFGATEKVDKRIGRQSGGLSHGWGSGTQKALGG